MSELAIRQPSANQRWPMTGEAWLTLVDELGRLRTDVVSLAGASSPHDGVVDLPVVKAARRLECYRRCSMPPSGSTSRTEP